MRGILVRVGTDQAFGGWNAPVDPGSGEFAYVPIPDGTQRRGLETSYSQVSPLYGASRACPAASRADEGDEVAHLVPDALPGDFRGVIVAWNPGSGVSRDLLRGSGVFGESCRDGFQ